MDNRNDYNSKNDPGRQEWEDLLNSIPDYPELGFTEDIPAEPEPPKTPVREPSAPVSKPLPKEPTPTPPPHRTEPFQVQIPDLDAGIQENIHDRDKPSADEIAQKIKQRAMMPLDPDEMPDLEPEMPSRQPRLSEQPPSQKQPRKRRKGRGWVAFARGIFTLLVIIAISIWLSSIAISAINDYLALYKEDTGEIVITIPEGASTQQIAEILKDNGIIENDWFFRLFCKLKDSDALFHSGEHTFGTDYSYTQIINELQTTNIRKDEITVTIPEGFTIRRMAERLEEKEVCSAEEFIAALDTVEYDFEFWDAEVFEQELRYYLWEGYLFPDTYNFYTNEDPEVVIRKLLANFENRLTDDYVDRAAEMGMTVDELVTLASIIQAESSGEDPQVMAMVSSVFHNRMDNADTYPKLQSDPTGYYVRDAIEPYLSDDENADDYYNVYDTYVCDGLPIGPITNPGLDAIEAALSPADTNYLYFVTDVNGQFYWAETLEEHNANIATVQSVNGEANSD